MVTRRCRFVWAGAASRLVSYLHQEYGEIPIYPDIYGPSLVRDLGRLYIVLSDAVEHRLRLEIVKRLGGKKGDLSGAIEEAVVDWLNRKPK